jgi:hypothetical protein
VALTGITVTPKTIKLAVGDQQKITVTAVPADATDVVYTYVSQNTSVATVDNNGIVTIAGVGKTTVTVTSATFSETVDVEGILNGITVKDADGNIAGTYPYNGQPITIALTAEVIPAGSDVTPVWTSNAANATVEAAGNGLTATVNLTGEGAAVITATVGDVAGTYAISTTSVFESAAGYWTFDDPANLGKATRGLDLTEVQYLEIVEGPSATKKAIQVVDRQPSLKWEHNLTISDYNYTHVWGDYGYKAADVFTLLFDVRPIDQWSGIDRINSPLYWNEYGEGSPFGVRVMDETMRLYSNGNAWTFDPFSPEKKEAKPWYRIVIKVWPAVPGDEGYNPDDANHPFHRDLWVNGVRIGDQIRGDNTLFRVAPIENASIWFFTGSQADRDRYDEQKQRYQDYIPLPCSTIAVWDRVLTDEEIISLGGVSK